MPPDAASPDTERLTRRIETLAGFVDPDAPGWTRRVFSEEYRAARDWLAAEMRDAGLDVHHDAAGNLVGVARGRHPDRGFLATGSHIDTVHGGGRFDGVLGVLGGLEAVQSLRESGTELDHDVWVVDFLGEEPNDFGLSCLGSRALTGALRAEDLGLVDGRGRRLGDVWAASAPDAAAREWSSVRAFVELHVEQGPHLERSGTPIGVVSEIVGVRRLRSHFSGRRDHAGTMPMDLRRDALAAAAEVVVATERAARDGRGVATCGHLEVRPGAMNVVPEAVELWTEFRSNDAAWLEAVHEAIVSATTAACEARDVASEIELLSQEAPVPAAATMTTTIAAAADAVGLGHTTLPSGAEHDSALMARVAPMGMVFVPSAGGRSHCPEEWTEPEDCAAGVHVLAQTLLRLDGTVGGG